MLCMGIIVVYRKNDSEHTKRLYGKNVEMSVLNRHNTEEGRRAFLRARPQIVYKFRKKILSCAYGNYEQQNKVLESSIIIIELLHYHYYLCIL